MNGGFLDTISSLNLFIVSVGLKFISGLGNSKNIWITKLRAIGVRLGMLGTIISLLKTATDNSLTQAEKMKIMFATVISYFIARAVSLIILAATPVGVLLTAIISMVLLTMISVVVSYLIKISFVYIHVRKKIKYTC